VSKCGDVLCLHRAESHVYSIFNVKQGKQLLNRTDEEIKESLCQKLKSFNNPQNARHKFTKIVTSVLIKVISLLTSLPSI